jgi:flagellar hook protein FlgE
MSLYGALFSGVSGLSSQSSAMGAIADNVTNVNTIGYKGTKVNFQTLVTKQVSLTKYSAGGIQSSPRTGIDIQGLLQATTSATDLSISGQGMFVVNESSRPSTGDQFAYTRAGSFKVDKDGYLVNVGGQYLQGWPLMTYDGNVAASSVQVGNNTYMKAYKNLNGDIAYINDNVIDSNNMRSLNLNTIGGTATATTTLALGATLPSGADINATEKTSALVYDSMGNPHNLLYTWNKQAQNTWGVNLQPPAQAASIQMRDQNNNIYYSAGRLDFRDTGIPANGSSLNFDGTTINVSSTIDPDGAGTFFAAGDENTMIPREQITVSGDAVDGETMTISYGSETITFEYDTDGSVTSGNVAIAVIAGNTTATASNVADAIQTQLEKRLGPGDWAKSSGGDILVGGPSTLNVDASSVSNVADAAYAGPALAMNISPTGKNLSEFVDSFAKAMNVALVGSQGAPKSPPGNWATRVAGTTGITFAADHTNDITYDTSNLLDANGDIAVQQTDGKSTPANTFTVTRVNGSIGWTVAGSSAITFNGDGTPDTFFGKDESTASDPRSKIYIDWTNGALDMNDTTVASGGSPAITQSWGNYNVSGGLQQGSTEYQLDYISQNGAKFGNFSGLSIGEDGIVTALFDNGVTRPIFMVPIATFVNPNGMESITGNTYIETDASGQPTVREAGSAGAGVVAAAALESSTVDLGEEFTNMITTQRAYSASAKIITTSDEMLDVLVSIKR